MKKLLQTLLIIIFTTVATVAQPRQNEQAKARIHAAKMAYITDRLHLSSAQASTFTPLYNEYESELKGLRQSFFSKYKGTNPDQADDATSKQWIDDNLDYQQQVIELKRRYNERFIKIISPQQLTDLYTSEREFKQILMQRLRQQRNGNPARMNRMNR